MFGWFKSDPKKKLQKEYEKTLRAAKDAEKQADRALQAELYAKAEELLKQIEAA